MVLLIAKDFLLLQLLFIFVLDSHYVIYKWSILDLILTFLARSSLDALRRWFFFEFVFLTFFTHIFSPMLNSYIKRLANPDLIEKDQHTYYV